MGTTADKLQNILNAKNAIKEKFSIGDDVKFIDYADNINAGSGGSNEMQFYKCTQVIPEEQWDYLIITSGNTSYTPMSFPDYFKYAYVAMDSTATGTARQWVSASPFDKLGVNSFYIIRFNADTGKWCVCSGANINSVIADLKEGTDYPWVDNLDDSNGYPSSTCVLRSNMLEGFYVCLDSNNTLLGNGYIFYGSNGHYTCKENNYTLTLSASGDCTVYDGDGGIIYSFPSAPAAIDDDAFEGVIYFMANPVRPEASSGRWGGVEILKTTEGYSEGESFVTLPYVYGANLIPQVGGIYDSETRISAAQMYPNLYGANAADFYLCGYVNRNYFSYNTIVVSGMPTNLFVGSTYMNYDTWESAAVPEDIAARDPNGTYTLQNPTDNYGYWWWKSENGCIIDKYDMGQPIIYPDENYKRTDKYVMVPMNEATYSSYEYPVPDDYTSYTWQLHDGSTVSGGSAVVPKPAEVEKYWEGYKLVLNDEGKYDLAAEKTKLTYADYMPVTGRIYDASATVEITNANLSEDALWACPRNMVGAAGVDSAENDEWLVTASGHWGDFCAWMLFDTDTELSGWVGDYSSPNTYSWVQWFNKKRPVLVKELEISYGGHGDLIYSFFFYGSDDGENWTQIGTEHPIEYNGNVGKVVFSTNNTMYRYHRFRPHNGSSNPIATVIRAFSQLPREVPK